MDPLWDELSFKRPEDDLLNYFTDKSIDNLFNEALSNLQDLDVPLGFASIAQPTHLGHSKKPSGTAIFGFADHTRQLSIGRPAPVIADNPGLVSPSQLSRRLPVLNDELDFNFSQPVEEAKPFHILEEDEESKPDLIVLGANPRLYRFPNLPPTSSPTPASTLRKLPEYYAVPPKYQYPENLDDLLDDPRQQQQPQSQYVPIPVVEPKVDLTNLVYLPPPSSYSTYESLEPHLPLPYSLPIRGGRTMYDPQFFSDTAEISSVPSSLPYKNNEILVHGDDTVVLTPFRSPMTPQKNRIQLEWSPIISPNARAASDVRRAIQELSPKRIIKKTSLLPPGELDHYWIGPDENKIFTCTFKDCGKKFTRRYNVRSHIQTHLSDRPFACAYCPKLFVRQHDLNRHVKAHTLLKNCRCSCGKVFTRVQGYKKHLATGRCQPMAGTTGEGVTKPKREIKDDMLDTATSSRLAEDLEEEFL